MSHEIWMDIKGWEEYYQISSIGTVRAKDKYIPHWRGGKRLLKGRQLSAFNRRGYLEVNLCINYHRYDISIHRLVAENFIANPLNLPQVNHKDGDKLNNRVNNLEWVTPSQNARHAVDTGLTPKRFGEANRQSKLTTYAVMLIQGLAESGIQSKKIANIFGVSPATICLIRKKQIWSHI